MTITTDIEQALIALRAGKLIALPTETVYGLGADATNAEAVYNIFAAKKRPLNNAVIVHIANINQVQQWASDFPPVALKLAEAFWPGPLTLILPKLPQVDYIITGGKETVALRIPAHAMALALLEKFGKGIAAPSANRFTHISPTTPQAVIAELGEKVDCVLDGGPCTVGIESTIIDCTEAQIRIVRTGMITEEAISAVVGQKILPAIVLAGIPGSTPMHYAPLTKTTLCTLSQLQEQLAMPDTKGIYLMHSELPQAAAANVIMMPKSAAAYAQKLYHSLRTADNGTYSHIYIEQVPESIEWHAIADRLQRASRRPSRRGLSKQQRRHMR